MRLLKRFEDLARLKLKNAVVTLGTFDGMHRGHLKVIRETVAKAKKAKGPAVVLTFAEHPFTVLFPNKIPPLITHLDRKIKILKELGVKYVVLIPFTKYFAHILAEDFVLEIVCRAIRVKEFCVGPNTTFGKGGKGDAALLKKLGKIHGFKVTVIPRVKIKGKFVSSTAVREAVSRGDLRAAASFLGRDYSLQGIVTKGKGLGRKFGFPTANLIPQNELLPPTGVYAVRVRWKNRLIPGVANLGYRPTFSRGEKPKLSLEAHLFNFRKPLYGEKVEIQFIAKLRAEKKFPTPGHLAAQIKKDIQKARRFLSF